MSRTTNKIAIFAWLFGVLFGGSQGADAFTLISNAGKPSYWRNGEVSFRFHTNTSGDFSGGTDFSGTAGDEFSPIRNAFQTWLNVSGLKLVLTELGQTGDTPTSSDRVNTIMWVNSNWRQLSFRPPSHALAVTLLSFDSDTGALADADIFFNSEFFSWAIVDSTSESGFIDIENIAAHEVGHLLGIDHSSEDIIETSETLLNATMYFASQAGETIRRDLTEDDMNAVKALYAAEVPAKPVVTSFEMIENDDFGTQVYRVRGQNFTSGTSFLLTKNTSAVSDVVSRYRAIVSSEEAEVTFEIPFSFPSGQATLVAFNHVSQLSTLNTSVSGALAATSSEGGGGCTIGHRGAFSNAQGMMWISLIFALGILACLLRKSCQVRQEPLTLKKKRFIRGCVDVWISKV